MNQWLPRHGVTLLEVIVSLLLITTVILVSVTASANLLRNKSNSMESIQGRDLVFQVLDEVTAVDFQDSDSNRVFGREANEMATNRTDFDDVDDYDNYVSTPPTHRDGSAINGYAGWSFSVTVSPAEPTSGGIVVLTSAAAPLRLITVSYVTPGGATGSESMLVSKLPNDMPTGTSYEKWRQLKLTFPDLRQVIVTAPLRNAPESSN